MSAFTDAMAIASHDVIEHLGETIYIEGAEFEAIFDDEEFQNETGRLRHTTITLRREDAKYVAKGNLVTARGKNFRITYVPGTSDPLIDIEVKNA